MSKDPSYLPRFGVYITLQAVKATVIGIGQNCPVLPTTVQSLACEAVTQL